MHHLPNTLSSSPFTNKDNSITPFVQVRFLLGSCISLRDEEYDQEERIGSPRGCDFRQKQSPMLCLVSLLIKKVTFSHTEVPDVHSEQHL